MMILFIIFISLIEINGNIIPRDNTFYPNGETGIFLFYNKNKSNQNIKPNSIYVTWYDIIFLFTLVILFVLLVIFLCYERFLFNYLFNLWSKIKSNNNKNNNEHVTILNRTFLLNNSSSIYFNTPQNTYYYH